MFACRIIAGLLIAAACTAPCFGQAAFETPPKRHYFHHYRLPPGAIGQGQLLRGYPMRGYFQPVEVSGPAGSRVSLAEGGHFAPATKNVARAGLLIGQVYRVKVDGIPLREDEAVFPTIELINRLYPPAGHEARFPIPIQLTEEELKMALDGQMVTRVIYLENPNTALPRRQDPTTQQYFEVHNKQDPLRIADQLGRPMAILRMGSRVPDRDGATGRFLFGTPPWIRLPDEIPPELNPMAIQHEAQRYPRQPLTR